jgi:hypothetical protein
MGARLKLKSERTKVTGTVVGSPSKTKFTVCKL